MQKATKNGDVREAREGRRRHVREGVQGERQGHRSAGGAEEDEAGDGRGRHPADGAARGVSAADAVAVAVRGAAAVRGARGEPEAGGRQAEAGAVPGVRVPGHGPQEVHRLPPQGPEPQGAPGPPGAELPVPALQGRRPLPLPRRPPPRPQAPEPAPRQGPRHPQDRRPRPRPRLHRPSQELHPRDRHPLVQSPRGLARVHPLLHRRRHVVRRLHLR